jgi:hypothetical protein
MSRFVGFHGAVSVARHALGGTPWRIKIAANPANGPIRVLAKALFGSFMNHSRLILTPTIRATRALSHMDYGSQRRFAFDSKMLDSAKRPAIIAFFAVHAPCPGGGIGRRTWFRSMRRKAWRFESSLGHQDSIRSNPKKSENPANICICGVFCFWCSNVFRWRRPCYMDNAAPGRGVDRIAIGNGRESPPSATVV